MNRVFITGDIHGSVQEINSIIAQIDNPNKNDIIIVAGDAGFEYQDYNMGSAKKAAKKFPGIWIVMRGNHDSSYWSEHTTWDEEEQKYIPFKNWSFTKDGYYLYQNKYPNIWYIPDDGAILNIGKYNILFCPGAYSVDKWYRLRNNYPWNPNEQLSTEARQALYDMLVEWKKIELDIDFVIGHTFPYKCNQYLEYLFLPNLDQRSIDKTTEHWLDEMAEIFETMPSFKHYFGGHFHDDHQLNDKYTLLYHDVENLADYEEEK